jgi:hypothetical protein
VPVKLPERGNPLRPPEYLLPEMEAVVARAQPYKKLLEFGATRVRIKHAAFKG